MLLALALLIPVDVINTCKSRIRRDSFRLCHVIGGKNGLAMKVKQVCDRHQSHCRILKAAFNWNTHINMRFWLNIC